MPNISKTRFTLFAIPKGHIYERIDEGKIPICQVLLKWCGSSSAKRISSCRLRLTDEYFHENSFKSLRFGYETNCL